MRQQTNPLFSKFIAHPPSGPALRRALGTTLLAAALTAAAITPAHAQGTTSLPDGAPITTPSNPAPESTSPLIIDAPITTTSELSAAPVSTESTPTGSNDFESTGPESTGTESKPAESTGDESKPAESTVSQPPAAGERRLVDELSDGAAQLYQKAKNDTEGLSARLGIFQWVAKGVIFYFILQAIHDWARANGVWPDWFPEIRIPVAVETPTQPAPVDPRIPPKGAYFRNCESMWAQGFGPVYRGEPGYRNGLDPAATGVACQR